MNGQIIIIGRGIAGLSLGYFLGKFGYRTRIIGQRSSGHCSSRVAQGVVASKGIFAVNNPFLAFKLGAGKFAYEFYQQIVRESAFKIPYIQGVHEVFQGYEQYKALRKRVYHNQFLGLSDQSVYFKEHLANSEFLESLSDFKAIEGSFFYPRDFWVHPELLIDGLEDMLKKEGHILEENRIKSIHNNQDTFQIALDDELVTTSQLFIAAGHGSGDILNNFSINLRLFNVAGGTLRISSIPVNDGVLKIAKRSCAIKDQLAFLGSFDCEALNESRDRTEDLINWFKGFFSINKTLDFKTYLGLRNRTRDRLPIASKYILPNEGPSLWILCGLFRNGYQLAPKLAKLMAYSFKSGKLHPELNPFSLTGRT